MLSEDAVRLFLHVSSRADRTLEDVSQDLGARVDDLRRARDELLGWQLLSAAPPGTGAMVPVPPDVALAGLVDADERRISALRADVAARRRTLMALLPAYQAARDTLSDASLVEVVEDPDAVFRLLIDVGRRVTREVLIVQPARGSTVERHEEGDAKDRELLAQGVARRTIYHDDRREHVPTRRSVAALEPLGALYRTLPVVPFRLLVFDRELALVSRQQDDADRAALVVRSADAVATLVAVFDAAWEFAHPFGGEPGDAGPALTPLQSAVLAGLAEGLTDEAVAGRLDISVSTCRRQISAVLALLGAESRFQAGVLAARRGWSAPPGPARRTGRHGA